MCAAIYKLNYTRPGTAIILNNQHFQCPLKQRKGSHVDVSRLLDTFESLRFNVFTFIDLTAQEMKDTMLDYARRDYSDIDCFICFIMSHGCDNGAIFGSDNEKIYLKQDLTRPFKMNKSLSNKPKLFFIQACRGENGTSCADLSNIPNDYEQRPLPPLKDELDSSAEADILYSYATVEGFTTYRDILTGSWYTQTLCDVISEHVTEELSHILLEVNNRLTNKGLVISNENQMRKKFYFRGKFIFIYLYNFK